MVAAVLERTGPRLVHNRAGANMAGGVASALLLATRPGGRMAGDSGLFEVDEFWLGQVVDELQPRALLLGNLFRDQLDRYGELDTIADRWLEVAARTPAALILNADDPTVADLGRLAAATRQRRGSRSSACRTTAWPWRRCSTRPTPSTAAAAAPRTSTRRSTSVTSAATTATTAGPRARRPTSRPTTWPSTAWRGARFTLRTPAGERGSDPPPRPLQRLQRARRGRAGARPGRLAGRRRRGPAGRLARLRTRRDAARRRP